jgi:hypothetical protein
LKSRYYASGCQGPSSLRRTSTVDKRALRAPFRTPSRFYPHPSTIRGTAWRITTGSSMLPVSSFGRLGSLLSLLFRSRLRTRSQRFSRAFGESRATTTPELANWMSRSSAKRRPPVGGAAQGMPFQLIAPPRRVCRAGQECLHWKRKCRSPQSDRIYEEES